MKSFLSVLATASIFSAGALLSTSPATAQQGPIKIGVPTSVQLQVGRDTQGAVKMAIEEINAKGGLLGRKLEMVVADETENPEQGIAAIKKLTADDKVDVLIGGLYQRRHAGPVAAYSNAKTIYIGVGAASPAITAKVKADYDNYKYIFRAFPIHAGHQARALVDFINGKLKGEMGLKKIAIVGENAKWVQDLVPILKKGRGRWRHRSADGRILRHFHVGLLAAVRQGQGQRRAVSDRDLSHASSDIFVKQWHDAQVPIPIGGIDVKSQDADFLHPREWQGARRNRRPVRDPRRADAEDDPVLG